LLADPAANYPASFGSISWLKEWPYALPNIVSSMFLFLSAIVVLLGLEEVSNFQQRTWLVAKIFTVA